MKSAIVLFMLASTLFACRGKSDSPASETAALQKKSGAQSVSMETIRKIIDKNLREERLPYNKLFSFDSYCLDISAVWLSLFAKEGLKAVLQETSGAAYLDLDGQRIQRAPTHFFIAFNPKTSDEFILDATYTQFIEGSAKLQLEPILLKRTSEISTVFETHSKNLRINVPFDEYAGKYNPAEIAELIYSTGRYAKNRTSHD